uniref:Solute carrier family 26 member 3, tandem duplicate 2 n=1 Tax=Paramormyrops kingsleyae TaxID=1676925 RepID=A0A3B3T5A1_9TELE
MRRPAHPYSVNRPVYSEDSFSEEHQNICRKHKTLQDHVKVYLRCDATRVKRVACSLLPIIQWVRLYNVKKWLVGDLVSGVSTGLVSVLQGLAYCLLASLPPWYGLYTAFFPVIIYFFLGTSRHISVGAFPVLSLMVGSVVTRLVPDEGPIANITGFEGLTKDEQRVMVAASVTFLMGIIQLAFGLVQAGFIVTYLSDVLISGYTTAAAIHILVSQLKFVLGLNIKNYTGPLALIYTLEEIFAQIENSNIASLVMSAIIIVVVFIVKELNERFKAKLPVPLPIEVAITVIACGVSYACKFVEKYDVDVVGKIPVGYEPPMAPSVEIFKLTVMDAFPMAIVAFAVAYSVAKVYAIKHEYTIDGNQELIAFGVSNIFGATFRSFAASTALSRTAVQESTGGKTQVAGLLSAIIVMIVTISIGFLLEPLPKAVLGAIVIINLKGMLMQMRVVGFLWKKDRPDCMVWLMTFGGSLLLGMDLGIPVGLAAELLALVFRTQFPRCSLLANISGTDIYRDCKDYRNIFAPSGVKIFRISTPIYFANVEFFRNKLNEYLGFNPLRVLRKRNKALQKIKKLLKSGELQITEKGLLYMTSNSNEDSDDEGNTEDLDQPSDYKDLPLQVNWNAELPANMRVPKVDVHSVILDFAAVSFLDISAIKGLKSALKELIRVEVDVYIVACDRYVLEKLHSCSFFDDEIKTSMFFLSLHDAMLHVMENHPIILEYNTLNEKVSCVSPALTSDSFSFQVLWPETKL